MIYRIDYTWEGGAYIATVSHCPTIVRALEIFEAELDPACHRNGVRSIECEDAVGLNPQFAFDARDYQ